MHLHWNTAGSAAVSWNSHRVALLCWDTTDVTRLDLNTVDLFVRLVVGNKTQDFVDLADNLE